MKIFTKIIKLLKIFSMTSKPPTSISYHLYKLFGISEEAEKSILFEVRHTNQAHIIFNRPKKFNSFSMGMYHVFMNRIDQALEMPEIKYIVIRGAGENFSSGNDLGNFMLPEVMEIENKQGLSKAMAIQLEKLAEKIITSEKPIFSIVQGKVVGFAFTQLALYDRVFAVDGAFFMAPLVKIAQGPEMASSYIFPEIFGQNLAQDILIKGKSMTVSDLDQYNFVQKCSNMGEAEQRLQQHLNQLNELDWASYVNARRLMRARMIEPMLKANREENKNLVERWTNPDLPAYLMNYMAKRKENKKKSENTKPRL